ncbi:TPA: hypothetical protein ACH3X1_003740 [Trebouxia sp. C0004]
MEFFSEFTKRLEVSGNEQMLSFARQTWQQLDDHAAQGPDAYRKFHDKKMSLALGHARPDRLSDRKALLRIDTSILANASSVLVDTAQVCIRIYRSAPSLAASMAGSLTHGKSQTSTDEPSVQPRLLWQSAKLTADAKGIIIVDIECSAKATDAAFEGQCRFGKSSLMQQVLQYVQQKAGVKLATKSAKITVLSTETVISKDLSASGRHEDLSQIPAASSSHLPASLLSKLSLVKPEDKRTNKSSGVSLPTRVSATAAPSTQAKRRPLIQEM